MNCATSGTEWLQSHEPSVEVVYQARLAVHKAVRNLFDVRLRQHRLRQLDRITSHQVHHRSEERLERASGGYRL